MSFWDSFWNIFWMFFWTFALFAYLIVLFRIVVDLFQDTALSGWWKALWVVCLFFLPFLTALVYLVARGGAMAARQALQAKMARESTESYIRSVSGPPSPAEEIAKAKALLEAGTISESEFAALKYRALASNGAPVTSAG